MTAETYGNILDRVRQLPPEEQAQLLKELADLVRKNGNRRSILELRGLGKEIWAGIDATEYVRRERASWNG